VDDWRSVLVRGPLEEVPPDEHTRASAVFAAQAKMVSTDVFRKPMDDIEFDWYRLDAESVTGRKASVAD
jgi:nitroimidazol reductase NimA-like FMN-containing flavoprotein (pyridoxamine 5'-phosphate oxidase superfamily)